MRGRHSARPPARGSGLPWAARFGAHNRIVLAVLVAFVAIAGTLVALAVIGPGHPAPARSALAGPHTSSPGPAGRLNGGSPVQVSSGQVTAPAQASPSRQPSPSATASGRPRNPFGTSADAYLSGRAGTVLAAVYDIRTGQTWQLGHGRAQDEASVVKLDVLETLLAERGRGGTGLSASDRSLTQQMIEDSDNDAATSLWYDVGGATGIRSYNTAAGLTGTAPSSCVVCAGFSWPGWGLTTTTPTDQIALLRQLAAPSKVLTSAERDYALSLMENVTPSQRWGVSGGVPDQVTVALKNGWLPLEGTDEDWQINSVGWVHGEGRNYLMAVLTTGNPSEQYGIDTIDRLATMAWQRLG
jgi:hypothetical protein